MIVFSSFFVTYLSVSFCFVAPLSGSDHPAFDEKKARALRKVREAGGFGERYDEMQPPSMPEINKNLVGTRLDVCILYILDDSNKEELRWSQGEVIGISDGKNMIRCGHRTACYKKGEAVQIKWDKNATRDEESCVTVQRLLKSKWNPKNQSEEAWRLDVKVAET